MQAAYLPQGTYWLVLSVYPTSTTWPYDCIWWGGGVDTSIGSDAVFSESGIQKEAWAIESTMNAPYSHLNLNYVVNKIAYDATDQFFFINEQTIAIHSSDYQPNSTYYAHFKLAPYLTAWDSIDQYGKIEGTWKDDTATTQDALLNSGTQQLIKVAQPILSWSVGVIDLYDLNPTVNWSEELRLGMNILVTDAKLDVTQLCMISKIQKNNLNTPHDIQLTLETILKDTPRLIAEQMSDTLDTHKYLGGQTVASPYVLTTQADGNNPGWFEFEIRPTTTLVPSLEFSLAAQAYQQAGSSGITTASTSSMPVVYDIIIDGNSSGIGSPCGATDILPYVTKNHQGQPTPGWHYIKVTPVA
jgi:hypothetical protein